MPRKTSQSSPKKLVNIIAITSALGTIIVTPLQIISTEVMPTRQVKFSFASYPTLSALTFKKTTTNGTTLAHTTEAVQYPSPNKK